MKATTIEEVREELVQLWGRLGPFWGVAPTTARVFAFLLTRDDPVDGDTIADELGMSRGAASMACRELIDWGLAHSERAPGSRRTAYRCEDDLERAIRGIVQTRKRREWDPILEHVRHWKATLQGQRGKDAVHLRSRLDDIEGVIGLVDSLAESFLRGSMLPKLGLRAIVRSARRRGARRTS